MKRIKKLLNRLGIHIETEKDSAFDIVCGMELKSLSLKHSSVHKGEIYYFCSESCKAHFDADPQKYTG
ncbi:MAG TPA: YHS domain-containing protein [Candidatus Paceibacterota bacterium]|nr:YHS domain-containing protein [Candidatus Paceibacterota bacterium]